MVIARSEAAKQSVRFEEVTGNWVISNWENGKITKLLSYVITNIPIVDCHASRGSARNDFCLFIFTQALKHSGTSSAARLAMTLFLFF
jgi:hypothetical protein